MKRTKLIASLLTSVMCLSFLVISVWAVAVSVNFNLNSGLKYYPEGVYVELSGQVYRGDSSTSLEPLTSDPRFTLDKQTNFDNSSGEPSGNFPMQSWEIDNLTFTPVDRYIEIRVTIKNHSAFIITATPTVLLNSLDTASNTFTNFTVTDNRSEVEAINSGATKTYTLLIEINENATAFTDNTLSVSFTFDSLLTWVEDNINTDTLNDGYWTLKMGEYIDPETQEKTPLVWRMILKETEASDGTTDVESVVGYTQETDLNGSYYFLLDTYIANVFSTAFGSADYAVSTARDFLINSQTDGFISRANLENSAVYNMVETRTLTDLYSNNGASTTKTPVEFTATGIDPNTTADKLWLLSYYEVSKISTRLDDGGSPNSVFWSRTRSGNNVYDVYPSGSIHYANATIYSQFVRPAFKITIN